MSLATWKKEFYPISAIKAAKSKDDVAATEHCIRKWEGARPENLKRHAVSVNRFYLLGDDGKASLALNSVSCALCVIHYDKLYTHEHSCQSCPIYRMKDASCSNEWHDFVDSEDPRPMIRLLKRTLRWLKKNKRS